MYPIILESSAAPKPIGPYAQAVQAGDFVFLSGFMSIDPETNEMQHFNADAAKQMTLVLSTMQNFLKTQKLSLSHVVRTTLYLVDINDYVAVNTVYAQFFLPHTPARTCIVSAGLPKGARVELDAIVLTQRTS